MTQAFVFIFYLQRGIVFSFSPSPFPSSQLSLMST